MTLRIEDIAALPPSVLRAALAPWVARHVVAPEPELVALERALQNLVDQADDATTSQMLTTFSAAGDAYRLHPADAFARALTRRFMESLTGDRSVEGLEHLDAFLEGPGRRMFVCNHLSYTDTQLTDTLLALAGRADVADRLVAIAGPKVYTDAWRRLAAIGLNTRKTAQSSAVATEQGALSPRELAAVAQETLRDCERLMDEGYIVLLYPEGTRSRTGRIQPFLRAAGRYLAITGLRVLPVAQTGSEQVFPIDDPLMHPSHVRLAFGPAFSAEDYPGRHGTGALAEAGRRIAELLPEGYRPPEGQAAVG